MLMVLVSLDWLFALEFIANGLYSLIGNGLLSTENNKAMYMVMVITDDENDK